MASARVKAFAKINLSLEVLNRRADGFHNLRTVFQTISLADVIEIEATRARRTSVDLTANIEIPGENLVARAAHAALEVLGMRAQVRFRLEKRIPMGGGLGGGSTDAAAVLMALPGLLGGTADRDKLHEAGARLGSDVPFFFVGGTALGLGRGTELYPLEDAPAAYGLLAAPGVHVSTPEAYRALARTEAVPAIEGRNAAERLIAQIASGAPPSDWACVNDFEPSAVERYAEIAKARQQLRKAGALPAMMTGSGAAVFGLFDSRAARDEAHQKLPAMLPITLLTRTRYRRAWSGLAGAV